MKDTKTIYEQLACTYRDEHIFSIPESVMIKSREQPKRLLSAV
ncbi:MAG: hypothetical protein ACI3XQ_11240 [Eubacteriales bacterium]